MITPNHNACRHCGGWHDGVCPRVKAVEYYPDGALKRVEYHPEPQQATPHWWELPQVTSGTVKTGGGGLTACW